MKHMMTFDIIDHVDGSFDSELEGWEHAQAVANGRAVRLVQSRRVDQDQTEVADLKASKLDPQLPEADNVAAGITVICAALALGIVVGWLLKGAL